jgi:glycosyltransferase involved in cell wall biosynthesis
VYSKHVRILMLNNEFPPIGGGTATANYYLLREFANREIHVDLVTSHPGRHGFEQISMGSTVRIFRVPIANRNLHYQSERELLTYLVRGFLQARRLMRIEPHGAYDLCHAWASVPAGLLAWLLQLKRHVPYVLAMRGADVPGYDVRYRHLYPVITPVIKMVWQGAAALTANSWGLKQLAHKTSPSQPIVVIPNGVDLERFNLPDHGTDDKGATLQLLCVARLVDRKGIADLLDAMPLILQHEKDVRLCIVGGGEKELFFKNRSVALGLQEVVEFRGLVQHGQLPPLYGQADIFVLPSLSEGMPNAVLEAMACGLPIITTDTGGTMELIGDNGIVVPKQTPSAIADAVIRLARNDGLRRAMGRHSRTIAETHLWEMVADRYLSLYQRVRPSA